MYIWCQHVLGDVHAHCPNSETATLIYWTRDSDANDYPRECPRHFKSRKICGTLFVNCD